MKFNLQNILQIYIIMTYKRSLIYKTQISIQ
jgi:hypothetical protein